ncbi:MAG TPA: class I SAM-dependent methyltransferase [Polyangiaceae bacterium]|nr:class I SAM-dependent methyltransferase [Polyangiaceae bacterium]
MEKAVAAFNRDALVNEGYLYANNARLSSALATRRLTDAVLAVARFRGKKVLDVGCGDGTYTLQLFDHASPASMHGVDHAANAIEVARTRVGDRPITYGVCSAESLPLADDSFDIAQLRGVLHHVNDPVKALKEAMRVAPVVVVTEPNGYNPILKVLEKVSRYHIEHEERSFFPFTLHSWARKLGGIVRSSMVVGLVPFFCPDRMAEILKAIEPVVERLPIVRSLALGTEVFVIERRRG